MQHRQMRLGVFVQTPGHHVAGWRHPDAVSGGPNLGLMKHIAATVERGKFDMFFLGDGFATGYSEHPSTIGKFEPISLRYCQGGESIIQSRSSLHDLLHRTPRSLGTWTAKDPALDHRELALESSEIPSRLLDVLNTPEPEG